MPREDLRLVAVEIAPTAPTPTSTTADASLAWELTTTHGDVLRVYRSMAPAEIAAVLTGLSSAGGRR